MGTGGTTIRAVCFHGRRERSGEGDFLAAARLLGRAAAKAGIFAQVRTPGFPKPAGSPDRVVVRLSPASFQDLDVPYRFHLEVVADSRLAVIPPMGDALLPGGWLLVNAPAPPPSPPSGPVVLAADFISMADRLNGSPGASLAAGAWAALDALSPEMRFSLHPLEEALAEEDEASLPLARAAFDAVQRLRPSGKPVTHTEN